MPDAPAPDLAALAAERLRVLREERARLDAEIAKLEHALDVLTDRPVNVNTVGMTPAQRRRISRGATSRMSKSTDAFSEAISIPHAGGPGYSIRSLAETLKGEGYKGCSRGSFTAYFDGLYKIAPKLAKRIRELTGYEFPSGMIRDK